jgi:LPXTG-motif cell wall-anchored protein
MVRMRRLLAAAGMVAVAVIGVAAPASAGSPSNTIPLNNATAAGSTDCPSTGGPYWHFVLAPNNGTFSFVSITLNLGGPGTVTFSGSQIIPNGTQTDNVFVQVPTGKLLTSLQTSGSFATYNSTTGRAPNRFNLSSVCTNYSGVAPEVLGVTQVQPEVAGAVQTSGQLPYTGSDSSIPMAQIGVGLLAVGALVTFAVRRRHASSNEV